MARSFVDYTGDGVTTNRAVPFDYIDEAHVHVLVDGVDTAFTWVNSGTISISPAPASGTFVHVYRSSSPDTRLVDYNVPGTLTEEDLDNDSLQAFFMAQEAIDTANSALVEDPATGQFDVNGKRLVNVADPVSAQDAATKAYGDAHWGGTAASSAATSAAASASSATDSANSATAAANSAAAAATSEANAASSAADTAAAVSTVEAALLSAFSTGDVKLTFKTVADSGWILMDDGTIGSASSGASTLAHADAQALYELLWNNIPDAWAAVVGGRGADAASDFAADKKLFLPKVLGRALAAAGTGTLAQTAVAASVNTSTDQIQVADASSYFTGTPVVFTTDTTAPSPLVSGTTYYAIYVDATHIKLASSLANAQNGTAIDLTTAGAGTHTFTINFSAHALGSVGGEEKHAMALAELLAHTHTVTPAMYFSGGNQPGENVMQGTPTNGNTYTTSSKGGNQAMNIMQPSTFLNVMAKL